MGTYDFRAIEQKWQSYWKENRSFVADKLSEKPKYYVLDMFPYPSGKGLHVGHPLGYIATDIITRYKRLKGFNVLHPMGFDAFGLPAEQYSIKHNVHPAEATRINTARFMNQMEIMGFHYDPDCELRTSDPEFYKWTQWIFLKMFDHWYNKSIEKAESIAKLIAAFEANGNTQIQATSSQKDSFTAAEWKAMSEQEQGEVLMNYRLAYSSFATVNWCEDLGTVLANEEVKDGKSERGGYPVEKRLMRQWMLRITAYSDRLLSSLETLDWSDAMKAMQTNWIGRSEGASIIYEVDDPNIEEKIEVFTTRPDTIFGNTFMVLAPEHPLVEQLTSDAQRAEVEQYKDWAKNRSEIDRIADTTKTGVWTGGYALNPFTGKQLPVWIADYVVITYGTGAIMAVPAHDERDYEFAHKFGIEIIEVISGGDISKEAYLSKDGIMVNSDFLNGLKASEAIPAIIAQLEAREIGKGEVTFRQRDVTWSRQRYWGEPTPIVHKDGVASAIDESELPLELPDLESFQPSPDGQPPLARAEGWANLPDGSVRDLNTMPGWAGSSWYFLRYPDAHNDDQFLDPERGKYWLPIDLYVGGTEHAVGHLMYSRFWTKFLYDLGELHVEEPFSRLVNQGMIQGTSQLAYRHKESNAFVSADLVENADAYVQIHMEVSIVKNQVLDIEGYRKWMDDQEAVFTANEKGDFLTTSQVEKMSKSYYNTVDPDDICEAYGADTLRLYEMFLGPIEVAKPWKTEGIEGVSKFLKRAYNLFIGEDESVVVTDEEPSADELKILHTMLKQVESGIDRFAFNTCVPAFMVFARDIGKLNSHKRAILEPFLVALSPFAPHICEELRERLGHAPSVLTETFPELNEAYLVEDMDEYPVQVNGKVRAKISAPAGSSKEEVEAIALADEAVQRYLDGKTPKKVIVVPKRIVNVVI